MFAPLTSGAELAGLIQAVGFLPFFENEIPGFSVEEATPPELWFQKDVEGPWEWKGPVLETGGCAYGKFFSGRAGFVSREWLPDFLNYRRDGYDFDARFDDGLASYKDKAVYDALCANDMIFSRDLKRLCGYQKGGNRGFEALITRLQMQGYVVIGGFERLVDRHGKPYGWANTRYSTPEARFGTELVSQAYSVSPAQSRERILGQLTTLLPGVPGEKLAKILG